MAKSKKNPKPKKRRAGRNGRPPNGTEDWRPVFLGAIRTGCHVSAAAKVAKVNLTTPYKERDDNEVFRLEWEKAGKIGTRLLEDEAQRRAFHGCTKPVYQGGELVGHIQEYSDTLLIFLLKARRPKTYRENISHEHTGKNGGPMRYENMTNEELNREIEERKNRLAAALGSRNGTTAERAATTTSEEFHGNGHTDGLGGQVSPPPPDDV